MSSTISKRGSKRICFSFNKNKKDGKLTVFCFSSIGESWPLWLQPFLPNKTILFHFSHLIRRKSEETIHSGNKRFMPFVQPPNIGRKSTQISMRKCGNVSFSPRLGQWMHIIEWRTPIMMATHIANLILFASALSSQIFGRKLKIIGGFREPGKPTFRLNGTTHLQCYISSHDLEIFCCFDINIYFFIY